MLKCQCSADMTILYAPLCVGPVICWKPIPVIYVIYYDCLSTKQPNASRISIILTHNQLDYINIIISVTVFALFFPLFFLQKHLCFNSFWCTILFCLPCVYEGDRERFATHTCITREMKTVFYNTYVALGKELSHPSASMLDWVPKFILKEDMHSMTEAESCLVLIEQQNSKVPFQYKRCCLNSVRNPTVPSKTILW